MTTTITTDARVGAIRAQRVAIMDAIAQATPHLEARAMAIAAFAHGLQFRKGTEEPYFVHAMRVYQRLCTVPGNTEHKRCAALLHDCVEDGDFTGVLQSDIERWFPPEVASMVDWLTDPPYEGTRAERKAQARKHSAEAPADVQDIKLVDIGDNVSNVRETNPEFAVIYLPEKHEQVTDLVLGNAELRQCTLTFIEGEMSQINEKAGMDAPKASSRKP